METVTCVDLDLAAIRKVVEAEGGCLAWGGALRLSPADDVFIGVERQLDVDPEGQLIASVLSKKIAAGANRLVLDIPVGPTAKVRSAKAGRRLAERLRTIASRFGIAAKCILTDGAQPVGRAIGPALEMIDVLAVLRLEKDAPQDLRERALQLSGVVLEHGGVAPRSGGYNLARDLLDSGCAYRKFERICVAQGGFREPSASRLQRELEADRTGRIQAIDNRKIARLAKFAGAPDCSAAGVQLHVKVGERVNRGDRVLTIHSDTSAELGYALDYCAAVGSPFAIEV
jgi:thymidine phosphorylase